MYRAGRSLFRDRGAISVDKALIRAGRALLGWSQDTLAQRAGVERHVVARFENGSRALPPANLARLVAALREAGVTAITHKSGAVSLRVDAETFRSLQSDERDDATG
jgi:DNA-binding XRE family transcriptional regulator